MLRGCMRGVYHRKAALIQACVRAMQGSMKLKEKKAAALIIHSAARMFLLRNRFRGMVAKVDRIESVALVFEFAENKFSGVSWFSLVLLLLDFES